MIGVAIQDAAGGNPACYRTAETWWKTREDFEADMASEEWQTIADDGFMPMVAGLEIVVYEVETEWTPEDDS